ncbi:MAG: dTDP-4-dehydrorhamnose 3,5-epimerase [Bacteroidota bacterium]
MIFEPTPLTGSYTITLTPFSDERGWFARTWCREEFRQIGQTKDWVQINHSFTAHAGAIRGMHYQLPPFAEIKMVRCIAGAVFDVMVDLRKGSPSFLQWFGTELSAENKKMIYIPEGFAHGFQTLAPNSELIYHHSEYFTPAAERAIPYDDPGLAIKWPLAPTDISERDRLHPALNNGFAGI